MASPNSYPAAFAPSGPDILALAGNYLSGNVLWCDSINGDDANAGTEPELPKKTWTSAQSVASANDVILLTPGFTETVSAANTLATANVTTISMGVGSAQARFTSAVAGVMWTLTGAGQKFYNCFFPASTAATTARIAISSATNVLLSGCFFECGVNDTTNCVSIAAAGARIEHSAFSVTASRPARAIQITGAVADCQFVDIDIDGGSFGWSSHAFDVTAAATRILCEDVRLANRSDFYITTTATSYQLFGVRAIDSSGCRVVLAA